jgi:hypothetical protein
MSLPIIPGPNNELVTQSLATPPQYPLLSSYADTASYALFAVTSSYYIISMSYIDSASYAESASYVLSSSYTLTASWSEISISSSYSNLSDTASYISWANVDESNEDTFNGTASYANFAFSASYVENTLSASYADSASYVMSSSYSETSSYSENTLSASYAETASYSETSSYSENTLSASYAVSTSYAETSSYSYTSSYSDTSSYTITASYALESPKYWGSWYSTDTQTASIANTAYPITVNTTSDGFDGFYISGSNGSTVSGSHIVIPKTAVYNFQFSLQIQNTAGGGANSVVNIWLRKNESDISWSNTQISAYSNSPYIVAAWNFVNKYNLGDKIELMWSTNHTNNHIVAIPSASPAPETPSVIFTITEV